jgi:hypothetical protein
VYAPLADLEEINTKCRIHLTKLLATRHGIKTGFSPADCEDGGGRGNAFFAAFDPWDTCLRIPFGSFRYFDTAERSGLITPSDAALLSRTLLSHGAELAAIYDGCFRSFFDEPRIKTILDQRHDLEHLSSSGLAVSGAWVDRFVESCPIPLIPEKHLESQSFQNIAPWDEVEYYAKTPWLALVEALDLISIGPWVGLHAQEIVAILDVLRQLATRKRREPAEIGRRVLGERIAIPFFSNGLQGVVIGFFHGVDHSQKELMRTTLTQFGQTLADVYASLRIQRLAETLVGTLHLDGLAREILHVISPVRKLILSRERGRVGYALAKEHNYWAGYRRLAAARDFERDISAMGFTIDGPHGVAIYIEPLTDVPNFHHQFTHIRLEMCLQRCFSGAPASKQPVPLSNGHLADLHTILSEAVGEQGVSISKLRQFYIISRVQAQWEIGRVGVTNLEMKKFLERELGKEVKNGYQVTSYAAEVERLFDGKVEIKKTRNALSLSWNTQE